jgi:hypothetical protein
MLSIDLPFFSIILVSLCDDSPVECLDRGEQLKESRDTWKLLVLDLDLGSDEMQLAQPLSR